ncbi:MAG: P1 family peptidase [Paracoccaceae bacterium]
MQSGPKNLITDVAGILVGNAADAQVKTGTTVLTAAKPFTAAVHVMGGAPGTRETDLLSPENLVQEVDALVLSGGSALGLSAASGVADSLRAQGKGFAVGDQNIPIVPAAILFDLMNGGDKGWKTNPYTALGIAALNDASEDFTLGTIGAGTGATTATLLGGLGSASIVLPSGHTVGALVAVNALGSATVEDGPHFWAAPWEIDGEFGGLGPAPNHDATKPPATKLDGIKNTTIAIVATDAALTQAQLKRIATAAHDGMARALLPSHTPLDGDLVFAVSTGTRPLDDPIADQLAIGHYAATCLARAIARGVHAARSTPNDVLPSWTSEFG